MKIPNKFASKLIWRELSLTNYIMVKNTIIYIYF